MKLISRPLTAAVAVAGAAILLGDGFAGGVGYVVEITNEGRHACSLRGAPGAAVQGNGPLVTLKPGATAHFSLIVHVAAAVCAHPAGGNVVIYLPGQRQAQNGWLTALACPGLRGGGVLGTGVIQPGAGVPFYNI